MKKEHAKIISLFSRYLAIIVLGSYNFYLIYKIFTPLTIHATNLAIKLVTPTILSKDIIHFGQTTIQIAPSCIAGSAFFLLIALILSTSNIKPKTRALALLTSLATLFILNITRILILASMTSSPSFQALHFAFWHVLSTLFVVITYIATIKFYNIKSIPIISDFKYLKSLTSPRKNKHKKKKK